MYLKSGTGEGGEGHLSFKFCSFVFQHEVFGVERLTLSFKVENLEQLRAEQINSTIVQQRN